MKNINLFIFCLFLGALVILSACNDKNDFPNEPVITKIDFDLVNTYLIVDFTDGDGDFGISPDDPDFPFYLDSDSTIPNPYYYNLWIDYFEKREGKWVLIEPENTFNFRVKVLTPEGQNKQLEVRITNDLSTEIPYLFAESDTVKFGVTLVDRSLNESVTEETAELVIPVN